MKSLTQTLPSLSGMTLGTYTNIGSSQLPKEEKNTAEKSCVVDLAAMTLSVLEDLDSDEEQ